MKVVPRNTNARREVNLCNTCVYDCEGIYHGPPSIKILHFTGDGET